MRALATPFLFACAAMSASAQAVFPPVVLSGMDGAHLVGVFPSLALPVDPGAGTGGTWNFTAIPEPIGRFVRPSAWMEEGMWASVPVPQVIGEAGMDHRTTNDTAAPYERISSTTRLWSHDGTGHIDFSWATYADLVRVKLVSIDSLFKGDEQITTTRYLWYVADNGTPVLELSRQDGGAAPDAIGVYTVIARYEELGFMARSGGPTEVVAGKTTGTASTGLMATMEGGPVAVPFAAEQ